MTRAQALILGLLAGFVALAFMAVALLLVIKPTSLNFRPTSTPILPTLPPTTTPTLPNFMPTAGPTSTPGEPTPTNTRVPTATPRPSNTPAPTIVINLPTRRPTATPTVPMATSIPPTNTSIPSLPTLASRYFSVSFKADKTELTKGECTNLRWQVQGAIIIFLNDRNVEPEGKKKVCPEEDTTYKLTIEFPDQAILEHKTIEITVQNENDGGNDNDNEG